MNTKTLIVAGAALGFACTLAQAQPTAERNGLLTNSDGRTLYTFDKDSKGASVCNGGCAAAWPPFMAEGAVKGSGRFSVVTRDDGAKQWAIEGKPLYFFAADQKAGDVNGDGQGGVWHVVKQAAAKASRSGGYGSSYGGDGHASSGDSSYNYYGN